MIWDISPFVTVTILGTPFLLLVMLLPTFLEVKRPRDAGPRLIMPDFREFSGVLPAKISLVADIEETHELEFLIKPLIIDLLSSLPDIDA